MQETRDDIRRTDAMIGCIFIFVCTCIVAAIGALMGLAAFYVFHG